MSQTVSTIKKLNNIRLKLLSSISDVLSKRTVISNGSTSKHYLEIPSKSSVIPHSLRLIFNGGPANLHQYCDKRHKELGPIFREYLGSNELIFIADPQLIRIVVANEGQYPHHSIPESWTFYNKVHSIQRGLFFQNGEDWMKLRRAFNKVMFHPDVVTEYNDSLIEINNDLMNNWISEEDIKSTGGSIILDDLKKDLCRWSIESTGSMLFGLRMGCVKQSASHDPRADELVDNVAAMFYETSRFQLLPVALAHRWNLGTWRRFEWASSNMLRIATDYTNENIDKARNMKPSCSLVGDLLKNETLGPEELSRSVVDLIIAAADTTSNSLQWMLYILSKHQDVQSKILAEVESLSVSSTGDPASFMDNIPYLKSFVREVLRLYPTAPFLARTLDKPIVLDGYSIPAGKPIVFSLYTTSRMERFFESPAEFKPERWLRDKDATKDVSCRAASAYASLPFGIGARMCVGRRAAELEMCLFIASFVERFESSALDDDISIKLKMVLSPSKPIRLNLKQRSR